MELQTDIIDKCLGRQHLDAYMDMRKKAMDDRSVDPENLDEIHVSTREWIVSSGFETTVDYTKYDKESIKLKMLGLVDYLRLNHPADITESEAIATELFIESAFGMYEDVMAGETLDEHRDCSFAFLVPGRLGKSEEQRIYGQESEMIIPVLRYIPNELRAMFIVGVPPFVLDTYKSDDTGRRGYLICGLVTPANMFIEMPFDEALNQSQKNIDDAVNFSTGLGAESIGLGAVLPALTYYGQTITNKEVITTTGHGGTIVLIEKMIAAAVERGVVADESIKNIGVIGLGSIGASIAHLVAENHPDANVTIYDERIEKIERTKTDLGRIGIGVDVAESIQELFSKTEVIISAITSKVDLEKEMVDSLEGKFIIDDSQPGCFDKKQVEKLGGYVAWVVGTDSQKMIARDQWGYGTFIDERNDLFGCEIEAATLYEERKKLREKGLSDIEIEDESRKIAIKGPVTPKITKKWEAIFGERILPAKFQIFGEYIDE